MQVHNCLYGSIIQKTQELIIWLHPIFEDKPKKNKSARQEGGHNNKKNK